jgi:hypothetical protein
VQGIRDLGRQFALVQPGRRKAQLRSVLLISSSGGCPGRSSSRAIVTASGPHCSRCACSAPRAATSWRGTSERRRTWSSRLPFDHRVGRPVSVSNSSPAWAAGSSLDR